MARAKKEKPRKWQLFLDTTTNLCEALRIIATQIDNAGAKIVRLVTAYRLDDDFKSYLHIDLIVKGLPDSAMAEIEAKLADNLIQQ